MKIKNIGYDILLRIDRGENLIESLKTACLQNNITCASVNGIGAADIITCGVYNINTKEYKELGFEGTFEILSLSGNITTMNAQPYIHIHITASDENGVCFGGHLKEARISATCEIVLNIIDCNIDRFYDEKTGLNLINI